MKPARIPAATLICVLVFGLIGVQADQNTITVNAIQGEKFFKKITAVDVEKGTIAFDDQTYKCTELMDVKLADVDPSPVKFEGTVDPKNKYRIIFRNGNYIMGNILEGQVIGTDLYLKVDPETGSKPVLYLAGTVAAVQNLAPEAYRLMALNDLVRDADNTPFGKIMFNGQLVNADRLRGIYETDSAAFNEHAKEMLEEKTNTILERIKTRTDSDYYFNIIREKSDRKEYRGYVIAIKNLESGLEVSFKDSRTQKVIKNNLDNIFGLAFKDNGISRPKGFGTDPYIKILTTKGSILTGKIIGSSENSFTLEADCDTKDDKGTTMPLRFEVLFGTIANIEFFNGDFEYLSDIDDKLIKREEYGDIEPASGGSEYQFGMRRDHSTEWVRKSDELPPIKIKGKVYKKGLGTHSYNKISFNIGGRFSAFKAIVGFNDPFDGNPNNIGDVDIEILCDGKSVFSQKGYKPKHDPINIDIPLKGVQELTLIVDFGQNGNRMDRISWANAILVK